MLVTSSVVYATSVGGKTIDQDWYGGNPFATALVGLAKNESLQLRNLLHKVKTATTATTNGLQVPEWELLPGHGRWRLVNNKAQALDSRQALLIMVSTYKSAQLGHLHGVAVDRQRVAAALASNGFSVTHSAGHGKVGIMSALHSFSDQSKHADVALIYCTGHGAHTAKGTILLPHDYPICRGFSSATVVECAVAVESLRVAPQAKSINVVFFAGCRTRE